jgi:hypothetical protein
MEVDSGWTSPALLGNPYSQHDYIIQDDDEMTILVSFLSLCFPFNRAIISN